MAHEQSRDGGLQRILQDAEEDFWAVPSDRNASSTTMRFDYAEQALMQRSLRLVQLLQENSTHDHVYQETAPTIDSSSHAADYWQSGDLDAGAVKREGENNGSYSEAAKDNNDYDQALPSNKGSPSISLPSRPHAAVEKRYRRTVNNKLQQLHSAIPASGSFSLDPAERFRSSMDGSEPEQAAKPVVLDKAIQYTTHLIETYQKYDHEIESLRQQVREWLGEDGSAASPTNTTKSVG